jgi:hypothetical protein
MTTSQHDLQKIIHKFEKDLKKLGRHLDKLRTFENQIPILPEKSAPRSDVPSMVDTPETLDALHARWQFSHDVYGPEVARNATRVLLALADNDIAAAQAMRAYAIIAARALHDPTAPRPSDSTSPPNDEEIGRFLSEWLDDSAPLNIRRYVLAARALARKFPLLGITYGTSLADPGVDPAEAQLEEKCSFCGHSRKRHMGVKHCVGGSLEGPNCNCSWFR